MKKMYLITILTLLHLASLAHAQSAALNNLKTVGNQAYGPNTQTDIRLVIASIVKVLLGFTGLLFVLLIIWGGFQWMTSGGNEKKIEDAKKRITNATIGLTLVLMAYAIARFITDSLSNAVSPDAASGVPETE